MELRVLKHIEDVRDPSWSFRLASLMLLRACKHGSNDRRPPDNGFVTAGTIDLCRPQLGKTAVGCKYVADRAATLLR